jgi:hypothetical protein
MSHGIYDYKQKGLLYKMANYTEIDYFTYSITAVDVAEHFASSVLLNLYLYLN